MLYRQYTGQVSAGKSPQGEPVIALSIVAAASGIGAMGHGLARRNWRLARMGGAVMLATAGAWAFGPLGAAVGVVALVLLRRHERRSGPGSKAEYEK
jgi:hypothetical protein